jgi:beta-glucuronidase
MAAAALLPIAFGCLVLAGAGNGESSDSGLSDQPVTTDGPAGRVLLGGQWLFRADPTDRGKRSGWARDAGAQGWTAVTVPWAWNGADYSRRSQNGSVGWYRKDFELPAGSEHRSWVLLLDGVNYEADVFVNGARAGGGRGLGTPIQVPARGIRAGPNRLVVRVDNRPLASGLTTGLRRFWNFGGILREVYLRPVDPVELTDVVARPALGCPGCAADVYFRVRLANRSPASQRVRLIAHVGEGSRALGSIRLRPGAGGTVKGHVNVPDPHLWSPADPYLYPASVSAVSSGAEVAREDLHIGLRSVAVHNGRFLLNGSPMRLYGVGLHEAWPGTGSALTPAQRAGDFEFLAKLHVNVIRSQYPLHPAALEAADRAGILVWEDIPIDVLSSQELAQPSLRRQARSYLGRLIARDQNHPSVFVWSLGNELELRYRHPDRNLASYLVGMTRLARSLDPTRLVGLERGVLGTRPFPPYRLLDVIGINTYPGRFYGRPRDRHKLSRIVSTLHRQSPRQALFITETGAETSHRQHGRGGVEEQLNTLRWELPVFIHQPYLNGAMVWVLRDFPARPDWALSHQPFNHKGLLSFYNDPKPAFFYVADLFSRLTGKR